MKKILLLHILFIITISSCKNNDASIKNISSSKLLDYKALNHRHLNIDSLYSIVNNSNADTIKVLNLISVFKASIKNRPIRVDVLEEAYSLAKKINYETGIAISLSRMGLNARFSHEYLKSVKLHKEAITYFKNSWDIENRIKNLNSLGVSYRRLNLEDEAIKYYIEALKESEKVNSQKSIAIALNGIGNSYITLKKYDEAIEYFKLALNIEKLEQSDRGMGYDYSNLGEAYMYKEQYDSSLFYHNKSLDIANKLNIENDKAIINSSIGFMYQHKGEQKIALDFYKKAIPVLTKHNSKRLLSFTLINTGIAYKNLNNYFKAEKYLYEGLNISKEISSKDNIISGLEALSNLYEKKSNYKKALDKFKLTTIYRDSIFNIQSENNLVAMNIKYNTEKKDQKINELKLKSKVLDSKIIIQFLAIIILILVGVFYQVYIRIRTKNKQLEITNMRHQIEEYLAKLTEYKEKDCDNKRNKIHEDLKKYGLTDREEEVLKLIAKGLKNKEIAEEMFVSLSTVKTHTKNIFEKLDVRNRIEAVNKTNSL